MSFAFLMIMYKIVHPNIFGTRVVAKSLLGKQEIGVSKFKILEGGILLIRCDALSFAPKIY